MRYLGIVLCLFLLAGCGTTGKRTDITIRINVEAQGDVAISPLIDQESLMGDVRDLSTSYDPNVPVDLGFSLTPEQQLVEAGKSLAAAKIVKEAVEIEKEVPVLKPDKEKVIVDETLPVELDVMEEARFHGRNSENNRPVWYFSKEMKEYPADFTIIVEDCGVLDIQGNTGKRIDFDENRKVVTENQSRDRWFVAQSEVAGRGMVVVAPRGCLSEKAYIPVKKKVNG